MNKQTYHTILESVEIRNNILNMIQALNNVMSTYDSAGIRHMTLEEAKDFLWDINQINQFIEQNKLSKKKK